MRNLTIHIAFLLFLSCCFVEKVTCEERLDTRATTHVTADSYCQQVYSNASYMCRDQYRTGYEYLCSSLYCYDAIYLRKCVYSVPPQDSTLCGNGKWCENHHCTRNGNAEVTTDTCPLGDSTKPDVILHMDCQETVAKRPSLCRYEDVGRTWCCESCNNYTKATPATFSGPALSADKDCTNLFGPNSYFCQTDSHYNGDFSSTCQKLFCYNPTTGVCEAYPASDGVPCGDGQWCVEGQCVQSTNASTDPMADCLYGNQYQVFCHGNIVYPNIAKYCSQYESGCCSACLPHKDPANVGCEYGDLDPEACNAHKLDGSITTFCASNQADCCHTCATLQTTGNADCPYGDAHPTNCAALMVDTIGPGNCYNDVHKKECCSTCPKYYNASNVGCEYGDHWKDYCATNVQQPNVATECSKYSSQCCASCRAYESHGYPGCRYGDKDPQGCKALMQYGKGTGNCYNHIHQAQCCGTCHALKDSSTPGCLYGDKDPITCETNLQDTHGKGNGSCYDIGVQLDCCRSCGAIRNDSNPGCEYGDHHQQFCRDNIYSNDTAFICFTNENSCCETCKDWVISDQPDCKYGDKNPTNCQFRITNEADAIKLCPTLGVDCCMTCSQYGHPGPAGPVQFGK